MAVAMDTFKEWLKEELERARQESRDSRASGVNSAGHNFDAGYLDALLRVERFLADGEE
jgi:hypothetical protein